MKIIPALKFVVPAVLLIAFTAYWLGKSNSANDKANQLFERGVLFADRGDYDMAIEDFTEALKLQPKNAKIYYNRGDAYYNYIKGDNNKAIADYNQAIKLKPDYAEAYNNRGYLYSIAGDSDKAIADINQAIKLNPNDADAYNNRGLAYYVKGDINKAIEDYSQAIELNPDYASAYGLRGFAYSVKGDYDSAIEDYSQAIELNPDNAEAYNSRGLEYFKKSDINEAIADFNQSLKLDSDNAKAYNNRGSAYYVKGDYNKAIADYNQAIKLDPDDEAAKENLKEARKMQGSGGSRGTLKMLTAKSSKSNFSTYNLLKDKNFAKDIDKVLKNVAGLQTSGKTELGGRRGAADGGFNDGYAEGGSSSSLKAPSARDIDMGSGDGSRSEADIMEVVNARMPGLRKIYNKYLESKYFSGIVTLKFTIAPGGDVTSISILSSSTGNPKFDDAIKNAVADWKWKAIKSGNTTPTIPFNFSE